MEPNQQLMNEEQLVATMMVLKLVVHPVAMRQCWFARDSLAAFVGLMLVLQRIRAPAHIAVAAPELALFHRQQHALLDCK